MSIVYMLKGGYEGMGDTSRLEWQYENDKGEINYDAVGRAMWGRNFSHVAFDGGDIATKEGNKQQAKNLARFLKDYPQAVLKTKWEFGHLIVLAWRSWYSYMGDEFSTPFFIGKPSEWKEGKSQ